MPESIRIDESAYNILSHVRKKLRESGQAGADFSDAIRRMREVISQLDGDEMAGF